MEEQTTTNTPVETGGQAIQGVPVDDQGQAIPEPDKTEQEEAVEQTTEPTQEAPESKEPSEEKPEENSTVEWLKKKGVDPNSPEAIEKVAEMARNAEKAMHAKAQKASELEKAIDDGITQEAQVQGFTDEDRLDIVRLKTKMNVREFFDANPEAKPLEQAMIAELQTKPHLAGDLESLYANAVLKSGNIDAAKSQGKKEALESLAQKQTAAVPRGSAVSSVSTPAAITPDNVDQMVAGMSPEEYKKRLPEINNAMAGIPN